MPKRDAGRGGDQGGHKPGGGDRGSEMRIEIRPGEPGDALGVARVQVETWRDAYVGLLPDGTLLDLDEMRATIRWTRIIGQMGPGEPLTVADHDGAIIGFCQGGPARQGLDREILAEGERGLADADGIAEIYTLYVHPNYQQRGIGRALLGDVTRRLVGHGYDTLGAVTLLGNHHARRFYEALVGVAGEPLPSVVAGTPADQIAYLWTDMERLVRALETV